MISMSSALRASLATEYGLAAMMRLGCIKVFSGPQPNSADAAEQGSLLGTITQDGNEFHPGFSAGGLQLTYGPVVGACQSDGSWVLKITADGTPGWWRFVWNRPDDGSEELYVPRLDGQIGEGLVLPAGAVVNGQTIPIDSFYFLIPPVTLT